MGRRSTLVVVLAAMLGLAACTSDGEPAKSDGRCLYHIQGEYGIYTKWGPCPSPYAMPPWKQGNR
jgi:hypothetical protein